nr:hypothetical protein [Saccharothrix saharensis]
MLAIHCLSPADAFDGVVLRAVLRALDQHEAGVFGEPSSGDAAVVDGTVVADDGHDRCVGMGGEQLFEEVAEHHRDVLDRDVVVEGSGGEVDRTVHGAAAVRIQLGVRDTVFAPHIPHRT